MMSTIIRSATSTFANPVSRITLNNREGLINEHYFGRSVELTLKNYAAGGSLEITGAPVLHSNEIEIRDGAEGLLLPNATEPQYFTMFFVGRKSDDGLAASYFSALGGATTGLVQTINGTNTGYRARDSANSQTKQVTINNNPMTDNAVLCLRVNPEESGYRINARHYDGNIIKTNTGLFAGSRPAAHVLERQLSIGFGGSLFPGRIFAKAASLYSRILSDEEVRSIELFYRRWSLGL